MTRAPLRLFLASILTDSPSNPTDAIPDGELVSLTSVPVHCGECAKVAALAVATALSFVADLHDHPTT